MRLNINVTINQERKGTELIRNLIIESGSNDNGHYRKYADGTLEMWGHFTKTVAINGNNTTPYFSESQEITFPVTSLTGATVNVDVASTGSIWSAIIHSGNKTSTSFRLFGGVRYPSVDVAISWHATGTWK